MAPFCFCPCTATLPSKDPPSLPLPYPPRATFDCAPHPFPPRQTKPMKVKIIYTFSHLKTQ